MKPLLLVSDIQDTAVQSIANYFYLRKLPFVFISIEDLMYAPHWEVHTSQNSFYWKIITLDGTELSKKNFSAIYFRNRGIQYDLFSNKEDKQYASSEMQALFSGWLKFLDIPVLNRIHPMCLSGDETNLITAYYNLISFGIPVMNYDYSSRKTTEHYLHSIHKTQHINEFTSFEDLQNEIYIENIIGDTFVGKSTKIDASKFRGLAKHLSTPLLSVYFNKNKAEVFKAIGYSFNPRFETEAELVAFENLFLKSVA